MTMKLLQNEISQHDGSKTGNILLPDFGLRVRTQRQARRSNQPSEPGSQWPGAH